MLNRFLFFLTVAISLTLIGLVLFAPALVEANPEEYPRWLLLFALDATIRRAAVACAIGLFVTAIVFFRSRGRSWEGRSKRGRFANTIGA